MPRRKSQPKRRGRRHPAIRGGRVPRRNPRPSDGLKVAFGMIVFNGERAVMLIPESVDIHASGVYAIVNLNDGRGTAYIGQTTTSFRERVKNHCSTLNRGVHGNSHFQRAWGKYGADAFCFHVLEYIHDLETIAEREQYWLDVFRDTGRVYNAGACASPSFLGCSHSEESRRRMCEAQKDRKPITEETRRRMSNSAKRRFRLLGHPRQGKKHTPESIQRMREAHRGRVATEETRRKMSESHKGHIVTKETRCKISETNRISQRGNESHALPYSAFVNTETGGIIPPGHNLAKICREYGLNRECMRRVKSGSAKSHRGWELLGENYA